MFEQTKKSQNCNMRKEIIFVNYIFWYSVVGRIPHSVRPSPLFEGERETAKRAEEGPFCRGRKRKKGEGRRTKTIIPREEEEEEGGRDRQRRREDKRRGGRGLEEEETFAIHLPPTSHIGLSLKVSSGSETRRRRNQKPGFVVGQQQSLSVECLMCDSVCVLREIFVSHEKKGAGGER